MFIKPFAALRPAPEKVSAVASVRNVVDTQISPSHPKPDFLHVTSRSSRHH